MNRSTDENEMQAVWKFTMNKNVSKEELDRILTDHMLTASGTGLIPFPVADFAGLMTVQLSMIRKIAEIYEVPFLKEAVKNILYSLLGAFILTNSMPLLASFIKFIPVIGSSFGMTIMPIISGASTYATGKVFIQHFESGGTFLTFDPEKVKAYYAEMLKEGKNVAKTMTNNKSENNHDNT